MPPYLLAKPGKKTEWINMVKLIIISGKNSLWCTRGFVAQGNIVPRLKWVIIKTEFYQMDGNVRFKVEVCSHEIFWIQIQIWIISETLTSLRSNSNIISTYLN